MFYIVVVGVVLVDAPALRLDQTPLAV